MIGYRRLFTRFKHHYDRTRLWNRLPPRINLELDEDRPHRERVKLETYELLHEFYQRYPDIRYAYGRNTPGVAGTRIKNPAVIFVEKQKKLIEEGYSQNKSFEMVEQEMASIFDKQKEENRILRGFALNNRARSYLNYSQQLAELEGRAKVTQLERDTNKYIKEENRWNELLQGPSDNDQSVFADSPTSMNEKLKGLEYGRETLEDYFAMELAPKSQEETMNPNDYEAATYEIVKKKQNMKNTESLFDIQIGFLKRSEKLLELHKERSTINDGLKGLSDSEVIQKTREVPTRIKRNLKSLIKRLEKLNVKLNEDGSVNYSAIPYPHVVKSFQKIDNLVRIALMEKDLQFEYPQQLERLKIKADVLKVANAEEQKLERLKLEREIQIQQETELNYEQYFDCFVGDEVRDFKDFSLSGTKGFEANHELIFENDITDKTFEDYEDEYDREKRLRETWIDLKRKNAIGGPDARTAYEQLDLQREIIDKIRDVRWKIDQELVKNQMEPLFKQNYHRYTRDEFMLDADIHFNKLKSFFSKNPRVLKEDPVVGQEYLDIIKLIRRKKLLEFTSPAFRREDEEVYKEPKRRKRLMTEEDAKLEALQEEARLGLESLKHSSRSENRVEITNEKTQSKAKDSLVNQFNALTAKRR